MTGALRPAAHEVRAIQTQTTVTLLIGTTTGNTITLELDEKSFWSVLEPLLAFWGRFEGAESLELPVAQEPLPF